MWRQKDYRNKTCSHKCAGKLVGKVDWESINLEEIMLDLDCKFVAIGKLLGCSDNAVRKRAIKERLWS